MTSRRRFLSTTGASLAATAVTPAKDKDSPVCSIGLMADCQYADVDTAGSRHYRESPRKLREAVDQFNQRDLAFTVHLGDFIDRQLTSFDDLEPIVGLLKSKLYHALGNHDFDVPDADKDKILPRLGLETGYYRIKRDGFRFLVIDTTEVSTYRYPSDAPQTAAARLELEQLKKTGAVFAQPWNSRVSDQQLTWIEKELKEAGAADESVIVLGHHPVLPDEAHATWNCKDLQELFQRHSCAKAYLNGHNHAGAYANSDGFHYLTLDGMLETKDQNAYAFANLFPDRLAITGFGRQESRVLRFR